MARGGTAEAAEERERVHIEEGERQRVREKERETERRPGGRGTGRRIGRRGGSGRNTLSSGAHSRGDSDRQSARVRESPQTTFRVVCSARARRRRHRRRRRPLSEEPARFVVRGGVTTREETRGVEKRG